MHTVYPDSTVCDSTSIYTSCMSEVSSASSCTADIVLPTLGADNANDRCDDAADAASDGGGEAIRGSGLGVFFFGVVFFFFFFFLSTGVMASVGS